MEYGMYIRWYYTHIPLHTLTLTHAYTHSSLARSLLAPQFVCSFSFIFNIRLLVCVTVRIEESVYFLRVLYLLAHMFSSLLRHFFSSSSNYHRWLCCVCLCRILALLFRAPVLLLDFVFLALLLNISRRNLR